MKQIHYFAYGSNMLRARLQLRVGHVIRVGSFILHDYDLVFNCGWWSKNLFANVTRKLGSRVEGVLYSLNERQIHILDQNEGYPIAYEKFYMLDNLGRMIYGYHAVNPNYMRTKGKPALDYLNIVIEGALENNLAETYTKLIEYKNKNYSLKKKVISKL